MIYYVSTKYYMRREKINLNFYFDTSLPCLERFYEDFKLVVTLVQLSEMDRGSGGGRGYISNSE